MLKVANHSVAYGQSTIIRDLNLDVNENEIVAVVGRNGMGKTTLMKSLIGMTPSRAGSVSLNNTEYAGLGDPVQMVSIGLADNATTTANNDNNDNSKNSKSAAGYRPSTASPSNPPPAAMGYDCLAGP